MIWSKNHTNLELFIGYGYLPNLPVLKFIYKHMLFKYLKRYIAGKYFKIILGTKNFYTEA